MCSGDGVMKKIILHVGQYKTGSTSIQKLLWGARKELKEYGILYPDSFGRDGAHFQITDLLRKEFHNTGPHVDLSPLRDEIDGSAAEVVVISCEPLSGATVRWFGPEMMRYIWQRVLDLLQGFDVRVVCYVRRQDESIDSRIVQEIKGQSRRSAIDYEAFLYPKSSLNYHYFFHQMESLFGAGKVDVRLYDRKYLQNGDVRCDFLDYLGLSDVGFPVPDVEDNVSPSAKLVAFYRVLNSLKLDPDDYASLIAGLWREFGARDGVKAVVLGAEERGRVMAYFKESNRQFVEEYVPKEHRQVYAECFGRDVKNLESNIYMDCMEAWQILKRKGFEIRKRSAVM